MRWRLFVVIQAFLWIRSDAQQWVWAKHVDGICWSFDEHQDGRIFIFSTFNELHRITCIDPLGTMIWTKTIPAFPNSLALTGNTLIVLGFFQGSIAFDSVTLPGYGKKFNSRPQVQDGIVVHWVWGET